MYVPNIKSGRPSETHGNGRNETRLLVVIRYVAGKKKRVWVHASMQNRGPLASRISVSTNGIFCTMPRQNGVHTYSVVPIYTQHDTFCSRPVGPFVPPKENKGVQHATLLPLLFVFISRAAFLNQPNKWTTSIICRMN